MGYHYDENGQAYFLTPEEEEARNTGPGDEEPQETPPPPPEASPELGLPGMAAPQPFGPWSLAAGQQAQTQATSQQAAAYQLYLYDQLAQLDRHAQQASADRRFDVLEQLKYQREVLAHEIQKSNAQLAANPKNFVEGLLMGAQPGQTGPMSPQAAGQYLMGSPMIGQATGGRFGGVPGVPMRPPVNLATPGPGEAGVFSAGAGGGPAGLVAEGSGWRNPLFPFIQGRHLDPRVASEWQQTGNPNADILSSMFSFSGQDPRAAWGEFQSFLPKGSVAAPSRYS